MLTEICELTLGSRFHVHLPVVEFFSSGVLAHSNILVAISTVTDLLFVSAICVRISRSRLASNFLVSSEHMLRFSVTGILLQSTGLPNATSEASTIASGSTEIVGGTSACSLVRHAIRCLQIRG